MKTTVHATRPLRDLLRKAYRTVLADPSMREWHAREISVAELVRSWTLNPGGLLNDGCLAAILCDRHALLGNYGEAYHFAPLRTLVQRGALPVIKREVAKLLRRTANARELDDGEYKIFLSAMKPFRVPQSVSNRIVAVCFPSQLAATIVKNKINNVFSWFLPQIVDDKDDGAKKAKGWFARNQAVVKWIREVLPNTDDAWRNVLVWQLQEAIDAVNHIGKPKSSLKGQPLLVRTKVFPIMSPRRRRMGNNVAETPKNA